MTAIGKIESFDETQEKWETYVERVEQFFLASNIDEDHQVADSHARKRSTVKLANINPQTVS